MRKVFFFSLLVIVLVSLSWFKDLLAQDLSKVSDEQKKELLKIYNSKKGAKPSSTEVYTTPEIYNDSMIEESSTDSSQLESQNPLGAHRKQSPALT
ncbi:MAG TPA: hypothetical protein VHP63_07400, partial [candidate division Zixibacteria bacterium]|nr:hypothetical protein [candidate division Zixibacteria bacterium]